MCIFVSVEQASNKKEAMRIVGHDCAKIVKVSGGWLFFDTIAEYNTWRKQK